MLSDNPIPNTHIQLPYSTLPADTIVAWRAEQPLTNALFRNQIYRWWNKLSKLSAQKFALYFNDSFEFATALWGCWLAGKTVYLAGDTLLATCVALRSYVDGYIGEFSADCAPLILNQQDDITTPPTINYIPAEFAGLVVYTSGSTGQPQAIAKRLSQLIAEITTLEALFGAKIGKAEITATVSHQHIYGLLFKILWPIMTGRVIHTRSAVFLEELLPVLTSRTCILISSPAHLNRFPDSPALTVPTNCAHIIFCSGGILLPNIAHAIERLFGQAPLEVYGSSETGGIAWRQQATMLTANNNWQVMPGINWRIAENEVLEVQSPHLPNNHWTATSDKVVLVDAHHFLLKGRVDRIVKLEGKRISLDVIEHCLAASPWVAAVRVLLPPVENRSQRMVAFVVLTAEGKRQLQAIGKNALNNVLRQTLINDIESIAIPRFWRYLDALPVNTQGKTVNADLLALLSNTTEEILLPQSRLLQKDTTSTLFELIIPANLHYFAGHFTNAPVLPGVVQIDWAIYFGRQSFTLPAKFAGIQALKFQQLIQPNMKVLLALHYDAIKTTLSFTLYSDVGQYASGRILFKECTYD